MEAAARQFNEWKATRERELLRLKRQTQRDAVQIQHYEALQAKHKAVLKRKTEEAEAARKKLRVRGRARARRWEARPAARAAAAGRCQQVQPLADI